MSLKKQCPPNVARHMTKLLLGDPDAEVSGVRGEVPVHSHFAVMTLEDALEEFDQVYQLEEWDRLRDLQERMGEDGRSEG